MNKIKWGILGTANIAKWCTIPGMKQAEHCELYAIAGRSLEKAQFFAKEYGLTYYAAFKGCSDRTEASPKTIAFLINKVKEDNIKYIFHIELSNQKIAETISRETNAKILELHSAHNISLEDFNKNITYVDIMKNNLNNLKEVLK